jgi:hypothetical protein
LWNAYTDIYLQELNKQYRLFAEGKSLNPDQFERELIVFKQDWLANYKKIYDSKHPNG